MAGPRKLTIRSYNVGFGDCFLLSFEYARSSKHVLIDFGTTAKPKGATKTHMEKVARDIETVTNGKLHVIVATHRHRDHISGFGTKKTAAIIQGLDPDVIIQPWTEDPSAAIDARRAKTPIQRGKAQLIQTMADMDLVAQNAVSMAARARPRAGSHWAHLVQQLNFIGDDNLKNKAAVDNLIKWGKKKGNVRRYVRSGNSAGLSRVIPGVKVHVLGPPTLDQSEGIARYAKKSEQEYWHLAGQAGRRAMARKSPLARYGTRRIPAHARWLARRLRDAQAEQTLDLVRELDSVLNNTSVILLFEVGGMKFLFPGDAQLENWQFALGKHENLLKKVDLYKVGHHGSLNATPKSLWALFEKKSRSSGSGRLVTMMSTKAGHHGHEESNSEVPRRTLVDELEEFSDLLTTQDLDKDELCWELEYDFGASS